MRKQTCILPIICLHLYSVSLRHEEKQKRHFIPMAHSPPSRHFIVQHTRQPRSQPETTTQTCLRQNQQYEKRPTRHEISAGKSDINKVRTPTKSPKLLTHEPYPHHGTERSIKKRGQLLGRSWPRLSLRMK